MRNRRAFVGLLIAAMVWLVYLAQEHNEKRSEASATLALPSVPSVARKPAVHQAQVSHVHPTPELKQEEEADPSDDEKLQEARMITRVQLASVYAAEKTFFMEYGRYTTDIKFLGLNLSEAEIGFKMGFLSPTRPVVVAYVDSTLHEEPDRMDSDSLIGDTYQETNERYEYTNEAQGLSLKGLDSYCRQGCSADETQFEMLMAVPLSVGHTDVWLVNSEKDITLVQDGSPRSKTADPDGTAVNSIVQ
jgi:hypothetical protein